MAWYLFGFKRVIISCVGGIGLRGKLPMAKQVVFLINLTCFAHENNLFCPWKQVVFISRLREKVSIENSERKKNNEKTAVFRLCQGTYGNFTRHPKGVFRQISPQGRLASHCASAYSSSKGNKGSVWSSMATKGSGGAEVSWKWKESCAVRAAQRSNRYLPHPIFCMKGCFTRKALR